MDKINQQEIGFVKDIRDFLILLDGLPSVTVGEIVESENGVQGLVNTLLSETVEILQLTDGIVTPGQIFKRLGKKLSIEVSPHLLGRAINPLGKPVDGKGPIEITTNSIVMDLDQPAYGIEQRQFIQEQFETGVTLVDTLVPLGKGQRELVSGDARSGKTSFLIDTIVNQRNSGVICIYAIIGKPLSDVTNLTERLRDAHSLAHTIIVAATSSDLPPLIHIAPQAAMTIAEFFRKQGKDVLIILDDMGNHAKIYREISLLGNRSPGRESYPGDIFYQHAHILERAGKFNQTIGGGSITALPTIEINLSDMTGFIPTNLMAMTDGHLLFKASLSNQGQRPAIDIALSVSRVGRQTQNQVQNLLSTRIKQVLAQAEQLETVSRFSFELPKETQTILKQRDFIKESVKQDELTYIPREIQTVLLALPFTKFLQQVDVNFIGQNRNRLIQIFTTDPLVSPIARSSFNLKTEEELFIQLNSLINYIQGVITQDKNNISTSLKTANKSPGVVN